MNIRAVAGMMFEHIGQIVPQRDEAGLLLEFMPQGAYRDAATAKLHAYGSGPFCRFRIARSRREAGLYVLSLDDVPVYAGECLDLSKRYGPNGYGGISPRNCFDGGQPTNCRVNAAILSATKASHRLDLWFAALSSSRDERLAAETQLIQALHPTWNRAKLAGRAA